MDFLSINFIKNHSRIDADCEDEVLALYGNAAEATLLNYLDRSYDEIIDTYGEMPAPLVQAALMLVDVSYQYRSPVSPNNLNIVPYTFDILIKPYIKL